MKNWEATILPISRKAMPNDNEIRNRILRLAQKRGPQKSLCPSEVARELQPENWRPLMTDVRRATALLVEDGLVVVTQFGNPVDPLDANGHIRISLAQK